MTTTATTPLMIVLLVLPVVLAMPPGERRAFTMRALVPRANSTSDPGSSNNQNMSVGIQIWAPLVAIAALIIVLMVISFIRKRRLAATIRALRENGGSTTTATTANRTAPTTPRRPRRQRRTPSQISTRSLPAYMVEPGESELVLVRGEEATEDRMRSVPEDNERHEEEDITDQQTPLLETPPSRLEPPAESAARRSSHSFDTVRIGSDASHDALLHHTLSREELRQLGDAPPYEPPHEMVEIGPGASLARAASTVVSSPQQETAPASNVGASPGAASPNESVPSQGAQGRKSGFRKMMARIVRPTSSSSGAGSSSTTARQSTVVSPSEAPAVPESTPPAPAATPEPVRTHTRQGSNTTVASTFSRVRSRQPEHARTRSQSSATHLRSQSSFSTLARFSRSTISLNQAQAGSSTTNLPATNSNLSTTSISSPLAHTLIRTSFAYPSGGPTQEQIRFLSSRETLGRYGVPYGEAAMAQSRELLMTQLEPPPPFESPATETGPNAANSGGDGEQVDEASAANNENSLSSPSHQRSQSDPHARPSTPSSPNHSRLSTASSAQTVTVRPTLQPVSSAGSIETFQTAQELPGTPTSAKTTGRSEDAADLTLDMSMVSHTDTTLVDSPEAGTSTPTATPKKSPLQRKVSSSSSAEQRSPMVPDIEVAPASPRP